MKSLLFFVVSICAGCGVNVVHVGNDEGSSSTGWYNERGNVVTTAHAFDSDDTVTVTSLNGYVSKGLRRVGMSAFDVAEYSNGEAYKPRVCYNNADVGDFVTVSTLRGPYHARVKSKSLSTYMIKDYGAEFGDSGSPVTSWGCVVGVVRALTPRGVLVVAVQQ